MISRDKKRFWRVAEADNSPRPFISYLDLAESVASNQFMLGQISKLPREEAVAGLAIVPTVILGL